MPLPVTKNYHAFYSPYSNHVYHQYTLVLNNVIGMVLNKYLTEQKVPSMIYYPVPAHKQKMFEAFGGSQYNLPVTDWLTNVLFPFP
jgi:dTDP-4-amino-4,6-dideoxygalactose transaminase